MKLIKLDSMVSGLVKPLGSGSTTSIMGSIGSLSLQDSSIFNNGSSEDSKLTGITVTTSTMEPETCNSPKCLASRVGTS